MEESGKKTGRVLVNAALVTEELLVKAQDQQVKSGQRLTEILVFLGVNADAIRKALATRLKTLKGVFPSLNRILHVGVVFPLGQAPTAPCVFEKGMRSGGLGLNRLAQESVKQQSSCA